MRLLFSLFGVVAVATVLTGCGGSSGGSGTSSNQAVKDGGSVLPVANEPNGDLTLAQVQGIPAGTRVAVALDRNNSMPEMYRATVKGFDAINNVIWVGLDPSVTTQVAEGDSGSLIFTLPNSFPNGDARNQKRIGSLSFGSTDNLTDFFGTPISEIKATGVLPPTRVQSKVNAPTFNGKSLRPLTTLLTCTGIPDSLITRIKQRVTAGSLLKNLVSIRNPAIAKPSSPGTPKLDPLENNTLTTFMIRGDIVTSGATGSATASDGGGFVGYGHPFAGAGNVAMATTISQVQGIFLSPVVGTYKLANPIGNPTMTMTFDGINGVRFSVQKPLEVTLKTQLLDGSGNVSRTATHEVGFDGIVGDQAALLVTAVETSLLTFYDQQDDLNGSAIVNVTTVINGATVTTPFTIAPRQGIIFGFDPNDQTFETLDLDLFQIMQTVEASGDLTATVNITAQITLSSPPKHSAAKAVKTLSRG